MKFYSPLIVVEDIQRSKDFYQQVMHQAITADFGENVTFSDGFAIHLKAHFAGMTGVPASSIQLKSHWGELYFETEDLDGFMAELDQRPEVRLLHRIVTQPWQQRCVRFYDPDGHIIEVGEPLPQTVARLTRQGLTPEEISQKTGLPAVAVHHMLAARP